jgi:hypothetical protein
LYIHIHHSCIAQQTIIRCYKWACIDFSFHWSIDCAGNG